MEDRPSSTAGNAGMTGSAGSEPSLVDRAKQQAAELGQQARETTGQLAGQVGGQVKSQLSTQKDQVAGTIGSVAEALRMTGQQLRQQNQAPVGDYADTAAQMVDRFSGYLREHDVEDIVGEVEGFARRQPAVFLGAAFALGFMAARFLKSSGSAAYEQRYETTGRSYHDYGSIERPSYERSYDRPAYMGGQAGYAAPDYGRSSDLTLSGEGSRTGQSLTAHTGGAESSSYTRTLATENTDDTETDDSYAGTSGMRSSDNV